MHHLVLSLDSAGSRGKSVCVSVNDMELMLVRVTVEDAGHVRCLQTPPASIARHPLPHQSNQRGPHDVRTGLKRWSDMC